MGIIRLFLLFCIIFTNSLTADARGFGGTYGQGTTDAITSPSASGVPTTVSYSAWIFINGAGGQSFGTVFTQAGSNNNSFYMNDGIAFEFASFWTGSAGTWDLNDALGLQVWEHICITYNAASTLNNPIIYINGTSQSFTTSSLPVGSLKSTAGTITVGNGNNTNFDGKIVHFAEWNSLLSAAECQQLYHGASPLKIRRASLLYYFPLAYNKTALGEPDWGSSHLALTVTGTLYQPGIFVQRFPYTDNEKGQ